MSFDGRFYYRYDGGNRLKDVYSVAWSGSSPMMGLHYAHFDYDGPGRLIRSQYDTDADGSLSDEDTEWTPRDHLGRPIGIWRQAPPSGGTTPCAKPYQVFAYHNTSFRGEGSDDSRGILDAPAVRWRDVGTGDLTEMVSYLQDFRGDVRAVVSPSSGVLERERYGLTGRPEAFPAADVNFDGKVDEDDNDDFDQALLQYGGDTTKYDPRADLDRDGDVDSDDQSIFSASYSFYAGYGSQWRLSAGAGLAPGRSGGDAGLDNRFGWRGYWYDPHLRMYHVRNRAYDPRQGQFLQTDPLGFSAGDQNLYRYADGNFSSGYDPLGLEEACHDAIPGRPDLGRTCSVTGGVAAAPPSMSDCDRLNMQIQNLEKAMLRPTVFDDAPSNIVSFVPWFLRQISGDNDVTVEGGATAGGGAAGAAADVRLNRVEQRATAAMNAEKARAWPGFRSEPSTTGLRRINGAFEAGNGPLAQIFRVKLGIIGAAFFAYNGYMDIREAIDAAWSGDRFRAAHRTAYAIGDIGLGGVAMGMAAWTAATGSGVVAFGLAATPFGWTAALVGTLAWAADSYGAPAQINIIKLYGKIVAQREERAFMLQEYVRLQSLRLQSGCGGSSGSSPAAPAGGN